MDNDTRNPLKRNTATYLVQSFVASDKSHEFDLTCADLGILFIIARYLDMPQKTCFAKQSILAKECRTDRYQFGRRCNHLEKQGLIFRYFRGKLYHYELGHNITGIKQDEY